MKEENITTQDSPSDAEGVRSSDMFALNQTRIEKAGVMRCCLSTVASEYLELDGEPQMVKVGDNSSCKHCHTKFTLITAKPHPKWVPDWIINKANC